MIVSFHVKDYLNDLSKTVHKHLDGIKMNTLNNSKDAYEKQKQIINYAKTNRSLFTLVLLKYESTNCSGIHANALFTHFSFIIWIYKAIYSTSNYLTV